MSTAPPNRRIAEKGERIVWAMEGSGMGCDEQTMRAVGEALTAGR